MTVPGVTRTYSNQQDMLRDMAPIRQPGVAHQLREQLRAELAGIECQLRDSGMTDPLSQSIADWRRQFVYAINRSGDFNGALGTYISLLQGLLRDDIARIPLDERSLLGSDGRTYSLMSYSLYQHTAPVEFRERSPLDPENRARFTTSPHHNAAFMARWLQTHNAQQRCPDELERRYAQMMRETAGAAAGPLPISMRQPTLLQAPPRAGSSRGGCQSRNRPSRSIRPGPTAPQFEAAGQAA